MAETKEKSPFEFTPCSELTGKTAADFLDEHEQECLEPLRKYTQIAITKSVMEEWDSARVVSSSFRSVIRLRKHYETGKSLFTEELDVDRYTKFRWTMIFRILKKELEKAGYQVEHSARFSPNKDYIGQQLIISGWAKEEGDIPSTEEKE